MDRLRDRLKRLGEKLRSAADANGRAFWFGLAVIPLSLISALATGLILTGLTPLSPTHSVVTTALAVNAILIAMAIGVIAWQAVELLRARQRRAAASRLHARIVGLFSVIATVPAIILALFASISLDRGLDNWFSQRTQAIISNSLEVAEAYVQEHGQVLRADGIAMARDLDESVIPANGEGLVLSQQAGIRGIQLAYLIDANGAVLASAVQSKSAPFIAPPRSALQEAVGGTAVSIAPGSRNRVAVIQKLASRENTYLYVSRLVDSKVLRHLRLTRDGVAEYGALEQRRAGVQIAFGLMYLMVALTLLLAAIWIGLWFANALVAPVRRLIGAAQDVSDGKLDVRVPVKTREGDFANLANTFNQMTSELAVKRNELLSTNERLTERGHFIEAVLSGVSAGVLGLDMDGRIDAVNRAAAHLLGTTPVDLQGENIVDAVPELKDAFRDAARRKPNDAPLQLDITRDGVERNLVVQITLEQAGPKNDGYVITFDDITELVSAQRTAAWADVARRIAHEIKNPLTPIQLSAERIRRKYDKAITEDRDVFEKCTETIIRQVGDIGRMVDEFSAFARMPQPKKEQHDLRVLVKETVYLFQVGHPEIAFGFEMPDHAVPFECDRGLIAQLVTNLTKNAAEAIAAVHDGADTPENYSGKIEARLRDEGRTVTLMIIDNGCGLPAQNRRRLTEPYMTTREKGTGIGLAIVQKVAEQHGGVLYLEDAPEAVNGSRGAMMRIVLERRDALTDATDNADPDETTNDLADRQVA
ncbi:MAG: PAS domain-containing sensor histidine kinase [Pseudomonadota bacterium]